MSPDNFLDARKRVPDTSLPQAAVSPKGLGPHQIGQSSVFPACEGR